MTDNFCNKCGACCKRIKADFNTKILYWDEKTVLTDEFASMLIPVQNETNIFSCKFLKDNICTNPQKPEICRNYPKSPFVELPEECTCTGKIFIEKEKIMQKIRKLKEEIIYYDAIAAISTKKEQNQIQKLILSHQKHINKYKEYGSNDW